VYGDVLRAVRKQNENGRESWSTVDGPRSSCFLIHRPVLDVERHADRLFFVWKITKKSQNQYFKRIRGAIFANNATVGISHTFLHIHTSITRQRPAIQFGRDASCRNMQTQLVEELALHSQLVWIHKHVSHSHTSRGNRYGTFLDIAVLHHRFV
jgi:hypothetical protein